jgi:DNA (cytosine-5)-methyltransferase 1
MTIGSLFSGIGGLELGLERAGLGRTIWQVEVNPFCQKVLRKHWPDATLYPNIIDLTNLPYVDTICGGFPCQDVSGAAHGKNPGITGPRSGLWKEFARIISEVRPRRVVVENVASGASRWLPTVRSDLNALGYTTKALGISGRDVGAPHIRKRVFVIGYTHCHGQPTGTVYEEAPRLSESPGTLWNRWLPPPERLRVDAGLPVRLDRLQALGNSVIPQCASLAGWILRDWTEQNRQ